MKNQLFILLSFSFLFLYSCKKENPGQVTVSGITNSFVLKRDSVLFNPGYLEISDTFEYAVSIVAAESNQSHANVYRLLINKQIPVGVYDYETMTEEYSFWFSYSTPNYELCYITDGTFEVIQQDTVQKLLEMKFQFEMEDYNEYVYQVTEGSFKIHY